jgi:hypothetical protein
VGQQLARIAAVGLLAVSCMGCGLISWVGFGVFLGTQAIGGTANKLDETMRNQQVIDPNQTNAVKVHPATRGMKELPGGGWGTPSTTGICDPKCPVGPASLTPSPTGAGE